MTKIKLNSATETAYLDEVPSECPYCHHTITPIPITGIKNNYQREIEAVFQCPNNECRKCFIGYYDFNPETIMVYHSTFTYVVSKGDPKHEDISESIERISPDFVDIYNEATLAESEDLILICGAGYRKALEFLIKDYAISNNKTEKEKIIRMPLSQCINLFIENEKIKRMAERAVWLGNDHVHYYSEWKERDLEDLKYLIKITMHMIEIEVASKHYEKSMERRKKGANN